MTEDSPARDMRARCTFYSKTPAPDGAGYHYRPISLRGWEDGPLITFHPPAVGDLIWLNNYGTPGGSATWRVTGRDWLHNDYGSANWPYGSQHPVTGPLVTIIVEPAEGLFVDQVLEPDEAEEAPDTEAGTQ